MRPQQLLGHVPYSPADAGDSPIQPAHLGDGASLGLPVVEQQQPVRSAGGAGPGATTTSRPAGGQKDEQEQQGQQQADLGRPLPGDSMQLRSMLEAIAVVSPEGCPGTLPPHLAEPVAAEREPPGASAVKDL